MTEPLPNPEDIQEAIRKEDLEAIRKTLESAPLARTLGIEFINFQHGHAAAKLPVAALLPNFLGYVHTGAVFALAEQVMAAAANSLGHVGLPLSCEIHFLKGANPENELMADARVVDTQGRIARVIVEVTQGNVPVARITELVFLRSGAKM
jgi:uncharacterized protein (TIGR00369 family)